MYIYVCVCVCVCVCVSHFIIFIFTELGEKDEGNFAMWKTTYDNDFTEIDEIERYID